MTSGPRTAGWGSSLTSTAPREIQGNQAHVLSGHGERVHGQTTDASRSAGAAAPPQPARLSRARGFDNKAEAPTAHRRAHPSDLTAATRHGLDAIRIRSIRELRERPQRDCLIQRPSRRPSLSSCLCGPTRRHFHLSATWLWLGELARSSPRSCDPMPTPATGSSGLGGEPGNRGRLGKPDAGARPRRAGDPRALRRGRARPFSLGQQQRGDCASLRRDPARKLTPGGWSERRHEGDDLSCSC